MARDFNFTRPTYYNVLKALHEKGLIDNNNKDYILLPLPSCYA